MHKIESAVHVIAETSRKYAINGLRTGEVLQSIQNFKIKIVLVGAFSAGKSALLNAFLDQDILPENQVPETAIASELLYDSREYVEAVTASGVRCYTPAEAVGLDLKDVQYLKWHLNSPALQELQGYILVDMPGFNSGIQAHNKAILQYAYQANAYLLVIDAEDGGIRQSVSAFINEVRNYESNLAIAVTKSDLKTDGDLALIRESVKDAACEMFDHEVSVITTSKFDDQVRSKLRDLILQFSEEDIFRQTFLPQTLEMGEQVIRVLEVLKKNSSLNISDLEEEIRSREQTKKKLTQKLHNERTRLSDQLQNKVLDAILADAKNALMQQADVLTSSLESGGSNFSMLVNNILRPVLISSTKSYVEDSFDEFVSGLSFDTAGIGQDTNLNEIIEYFQEVNNNLKNLPEKIDNLNGVYKAVTTALAVTTTIVAPWLELILIFLPDVIKLILPLFQKNKHEEYHNEVCNKVIPGIIQKLRPEISSSLRELEPQMVEQMEEKMNEIIGLETGALKSVQDQIAARQDDFTRKVESIDADIANIRAAMDAI